MNVFKIKKNSFLTKRSQTELKLTIKTKYKIEIETRIKIQTKYARHSLKDLFIMSNVHSLTKLDYLVIRHMLKHKLLIPLKLFLQIHEHI